MPPTAAEPQVFRTEQIPRTLSLNGAPHSAPAQAGPGSTPFYGSSAFVPPAYMSSVNSNYTTSATPQPRVPYSFAELQQASKPAATGNFFFKKRRERLNWRLLASVDLDRVLKDVDVQVLQEVLPNVAFCDLASEDLRYVDPNFVKLFQLSQLIIEYVVHCQDYLSEQRNTSLEQLDAATRRVQTVEKDLEKSQSEIEALKKENKSLKKTMYAYQMVSKIPGALGNNGANIASYFKCNYCTKVFSTAFYLSSHLDRRHSDQPNYIEASKQQHSSIDKLAEFMEKFSEKMTSTEKTLREELEHKIQDEIVKRQRLDDAYDQEKLRYEREIQELKSAIHKGFSDERDLIHEEKRVIENILKSQNNVKPSNIGLLEDDIDKSKLEETIIAKFEEKQQSALHALQEAFHEELIELRNGFIEDKENDRHALESQLKAIQQALLSNKIPVPEPVQSDSQNNTTEVEEDVEIEYTLKKKKGQDWRESLDDVMKRLAKEEQDKKMVKTCSISWERIQELLKSHTNAPIAEEPYVRCLFDHAPNLISYQRTLLEALVEEEMKKRGMTKEHIVDHWNKDPFIAEFVAGKMMELDSTQLQKTNTDRAYGSLRTHLEREMEEMVEKNFVMQPKQITVQSLVDFARGKKSSRSRPVSVNKPDDVILNLPPLPRKVQSAASTPKPTLASPTKSSFLDRTNSANSRTGSVTFRESIDIAGENRPAPLSRQGLSDSEVSDSELQSMRRRNSSDKDLPRPPASNAERQLANVMVNSLQDGDKKKSKLVPKSVKNGFKKVKSIFKSGSGANSKQEEEQKRRQKEEEEDDDEEEEEEEEETEEEETEETELTEDEQEEDEEEDEEEEEEETELSEDEEEEEESELESESESEKKSPTQSREAYSVVKKQTITTKTVTTVGNQQTSTQLPQPQQQPQQQTQPKTITNAPAPKLIEPAKKDDNSSEISLTSISDLSEEEAKQLKAKLANSSTNNNATKPKPSTENDDDESSINISDLSDLESLEEPPKSALADSTRPKSAVKKEVKFEDTDIDSILDVDDLSDLKLNAPKTSLSVQNTPSSQSNGWMSNKPNTTAGPKIAEDDYEVDDDFDF